ncbi:MAG: lysylphosphatidylglycerol synthase domain-containing protein [Rickettsiales bacterium]|jgi:phosphatidylglycerol lysyltransferase|nr:lysylphosphatidylglycerol synthase domain-containing protein [Rickettsiales bacterium]
MSAQGTRFFKKLASRIGIVFFALAACMLYFQLRKYRLSEIFGAIAEIPSLHELFAVLACVAEYLILSCYDFLALKYVGKRMAAWKWMLAGMMGFVISNNAGNAAISGAAIRYRLYTRWRVRAGDIVKMLTFSGITYYLGASAVLMAGYNFLPPTNFTENPVSVILLACCCMFAAGYFVLCAVFRNKSFRVGGISFRVPDLRTAARQMVLGMADSVLAALILYFLTMHIAPIPFIQFIAVFVVAQTAGIFAQVPGGIGVFESVFMLAMPEGINRADLFASLLAFRVIYYLLPLAGIGGLFLIYERWLKSRMKRWRIFSLPGRRRK